MYQSSISATAPPKKTGGRGETLVCPPPPEELALEPRLLAPSTEIRLYLITLRHGKARQTASYKRCPQQLVVGAEAVALGVRCEDVVLHDGWHKEPTLHFPLAAYEQVAQILQRESIIPLAALPLEVLRLLRRELSPLPPDADFRSRVGETFWDYLRPFQREAVRFAVQRQGRVLIGDDMGLGKTVEALGVVAYYRAEGSCIILCPSSLRYNWLEEAVENTGIWSRDQVFVFKDGKHQWEATKPPRLVILTYGLLLQEPVMQRVLALGATSIILDECHMIKKTATLKLAQRTTQALRLCATMRRRVLVSGTPMTNCPRELFTIFQAIDETLFPHFWPFRSKPGDPRFYYSARYCAPTRRILFGGRPDVYQHSGLAHATELNLILTRLVMIARLKRAVAHELPAKLRQRFVVGELQGEGLVRMQAKVDQIATVLHDQGQLASNPMFLDLVRRTTSQKTPLIREYLREVVFPRLEADPSAKFLIFAHSQALLNAIQDEVVKANWGFMRIDGKVPPKARKDRVDAFQKDATQRVAVLSILAAGVGLTLTASCNVVMAEMTFGWDQMIQAEDRSHRIGQLKDVSIVYLTLKGSTDDTLFRMLNRKNDAMGRILQGRVDKIVAPEVRAGAKRARDGGDDDDDAIGEEEEEPTSVKSRRMEEFFPPQSNSRSS